MKKMMFVISQSIPIEQRKRERHFDMVFSSLKALNQHNKVFGALKVFEAPGKSNSSWQMISLECLVVNIGTYTD